MKKRLLFCLAFGPIFGFGQSPEIARFESLKKLTGSWCLTGKTGKTTIETWQSVNDSLFTIRTIRVNGGDTSLVETIRVERADDSVFYRSTVNGENDGQAVYFKMVDAGPDFWVFENLAHDFPQRIIYRWEITSVAPRLFARIEGTVNGELKGYDFKYSSCR